MGSLTTSKLSRFQHEVLDTFFRREQRFFLTGGAALAGFHLGHRTTEDLDLFALENHLAAGRAALQQVADELGATVENIFGSPEFHRSLLRRSSEGVLVDLVFERSLQGVHPKLRFGDVLVDPPQEILANKLCTLLSRAEVRDLVDVMTLDQAGYRIEDALSLAQRKDGGLTPSQLAWVLSQITIEDGASVPLSSPMEMRSVLLDLQRRLREMSFPCGPTAKVPPDE